MILLNRIFIFTTPLYMSVMWLAKLQEAPKKNKTRRKSQQQRQRRRGEARRTNADRPHDTRQLSPKQTQRPNIAFPLPSSLTYNSYLLALVFANTLPPTPHCTSLTHKSLHSFNKTRTNNEHHEHLTCIQAAQ